MRKITMIVLHCDGLRPHQHNSVKKIDAYHKSKGWKGIGYHFWVNRQGEVFTGRRLEEVGAHVVGHNSHSIGICYEGGLDTAGEACDTRTLLTILAASWPRPRRWAFRLQRYVFYLISPTFSQQF